jgi:hypothetical protein
MSNDTGHWRFATGKSMQSSPWLGFCSRLFDGYGLIHCHLSILIFPPICQVIQEAK